MEAMSLTGKVNHYCNLERGKYERCLIIHIQEGRSKKHKVVSLGSHTRICMVWWLLNLRG